MSWDCSVAPMVALNWIQQQPTIQCDMESTGIIVYAIVAVNDGAVYGKTTDQCPFDSSAVNATIIFHLLQQHIASLLM
jgi:hypothetical protein